MDSTTIPQTRAALNALSACWPSSSSIFSRKSREPSTSTRPPTNSVFRSVASTTLPMSWRESTWSRNSRRTMSAGSKYRSHCCTSLLFIFFLFIYLFICWCFVWCGSVWVAIYLGYFPAHPLRSGSVFYVLTATTTINRARHIFDFLYCISGRWLTFWMSSGVTVAEYKYGAHGPSTYPPQCNVIGEEKGKKKRGVQEKNNRTAELQTTQSLDFKQPHQWHKQTTTPSTK